MTKKICTPISARALLQFCQATGQVQGWATVERRGLRLLLLNCRNAMKLLSSSESCGLSFALGWVGLENWWEAHQELGVLPPSAWTHPEVLLVRHQIYAKTGAWTIATEIARLIMDLAPAKAESWLELAEVTLQNPSSGVDEARQILKTAHGLFPDHPMIAYKLSCLECRLGNLDEARLWLDKALANGSRKMISMMVLVEPSLEPLLEAN